MGRANGCQAGGHARSSEYASRRQRPPPRSVSDAMESYSPSAAEASAVAVQLAAYRLAWASLAGVPVAEVRAGFCYIRSGTTVRPADLLDEAGLVELITGLPPSEVI